MLNKDKDPVLWVPDIEKSVRAYNDWYRPTAPLIYEAARQRAAEAVLKAFDITRAFAGLDADVLVEHPELLLVARQVVAPPMARDRLITLAEVSRNLVQRMEEGTFPRRARKVDEQLESIVNTVATALDPVLFEFVRAGRPPTEREYDRAINVVSDRLARAFADPEIRNQQEQRQKELMASFLGGFGFKRSTSETWAMPAKSFAMGRNMPVEKETGKQVNLPVDCVVVPGSRRPLLAVELKSAGDFTNVNKRRKEEATKHEDLKRTYGSDVTMLLQLFGYFDVGYLSYEAGAGIDWAWDHRLSDLLPYLGVRPLRKRPNR